MAKLSPTQSLIFSALAEYLELTAKEAAEQLNLTHSTAHQCFKKMEKDDLVINTGKKRGGVPVWRITVHIPIEQKSTVEFRLTDFYNTLNELYRKYKNDPLFEIELIAIRKMVLDSRG